ncbi:MAG TPA: PrsW family glutamic-type intramembrane protease, partial [Candidatus Poseidoniaceae archaeon]|nr:PrsW family glutamic-type intramembrane protease [Candidatus Poseidoniaceae archaeon]
LENLQYIALSWTGGPLSFTLTSLIRAIGSIPGHALWTGLTGIGFAWYLLRNNNQHNDLEEENTIKENKWQLIDSKTNEILETTIENKNDSREIENHENLFIIKKDEEVSSSTNNLPNNLSFGLILAIIGHSFWNGSSFLVDYMSRTITSNIIISTIASILWIMILISGLLLIGRFILKNVILLPDKMV